MAKISRSKGPIKQKRAFRDAKLIVIATEGEKTEKQYFESSLFKDYRRRGKIRILPTTNEKGDASSPKHVKGRATDFITKWASTNGWNQGDECWLVIDYDRHAKGPLPGIVRELKQINKVDAYLAVSSPCFELWLYLHRADWTEGEISSGDMEKAMKVLLKEHGGYNKTNIRPERFQDGIDEAIQRAKELVPEGETDQRWPSNPGTDVGKLVESIRKLARTRK